MAKQQKLRVILDTNWYISASINRKSRRTLYALLTDERLKFLYADRLFEEFSEVISRPKFQKMITPNQVRRFIQLIPPIPIPKNTGAKFQPLAYYSPQLRRPTQSKFTACH